jgi:hypothetical protein
VTSRAITTVATLAGLRSMRGPYAEHFVFVVETGRVYRWVRDSALVDDARTVIVPLVGGFPGAWLLVRTPDAGDPLGDANATITMGGGAWRTLPAGTLTANRTLTLDPAGAAAGDDLEVTRLDLGAFTLALVNGGPAGGTIVTLPAAARSFAVAYFDGGNFVHRRSALML